MPARLKRISFLVSIFVVAVLAMAVISGQIVRATMAAPGSADDPLATKSYVDTGDKYSILQLTAGQTVLTGESTEVILRSGTAEAVAGTNGGMSDVTADSGGNLLTGVAIQRDHLIISPRNDGRGVRITSDVAFLMVKGSYTLQ